MGEYTYDLGVLRERATYLKAALPRATILYAVKANGHPAVVSTLAEICDGLDVASTGELALAENAKRVFCSGPAKPVELLAADAIISVESMTELHHLLDLGIKARILLRVNRLLPYLEGSHRMTGPTQFGFDPAALPAALRLARPLEVLGFHLHAGSDIPLDKYNDFIADSLDWALSSRHGFEVRMVNLGGGFGDFDPAALKVESPPGVELVFEPGRWLTADAGTYSAEVVDLKRNHGTWFAVIRGGMHQFRTPVAYGVSWPFTVIHHDEWPHPWPRPSIVDSLVTVAGELCTPNDVLARDHRVDLLRVGDTLLFSKAGAYGWDISPHQYLRHPSPRFMILS
jgi:2-[(L-alanin-3-ylcarbamoyl)methyl]-2-hydroxybutanedioate decarboxylase